MMWPVLISGIRSKVRNSEPIHLIDHQRLRISLRIHIPQRPSGRSGDVVSRWSRRQFPDGRMFYSLLRHAMNALRQSALE